MALHLIQNGLDIDNSNTNPPPLVDSNGRIYTVYRYIAGGGTHYLATAYSDDSGETWIEVRTTTDTGSVFPIGSCIDSQDRLHIAYAVTSNEVLTYRMFQAEAFSSEEVVHDGDTANENIEDLSIAVDSNDVPHIAWKQNNQAYYSNRSSGSWATRTRLDSSGTISAPRIVIDSDNYIYVIWKALIGGINHVIYYAKYTSFWTAEASLASAGSVGDQFQPSAVVDSNDNVHIIWKNLQATPDVISYIKYTKSTDTWGSVTTIENTTVDGSPIIYVDPSDNLYVIWEDSGDVYYIKYDGTWSSPTTLIADGTNYGLPTYYTPFYPQLEGKRTASPMAGFLFTATKSGALYLSESDDLILQTPLDKNYSKKANASLPTDDTNLSTLFTTSNYASVLSDDGNYVAQSATDQYTITQFKNKAENDTDEIHVTWIGKSSLAPTTSAVVLQIYNRSSASWENLTSNTSSPADTDFTLTASKTTNLDQYYDGNNWVSFRIYQLA